MPLAEEADDFGVDLLLENLLDDADGVLVGHAQPHEELGLHAGALEAARNGLAAAVHEDDLHADGRHEGDVAQKPLKGLGAFHDASAELDDDGRAPEILNVGHRLDQCRGLVDVGL